MEPAALFVELEDRARHRSWEYRHRQTERTNPDDGVFALPTLPRGWPAKRRAQRRPWHGTKCRRANYGTPKDRHHLVYRRDGDGTQGSRSVRPVVQESFTRARWKKSKHHLRRRRSGRRRRGQCALVLRKSGPGVSLRLARLRWTAGL